MAVSATPISTKLHNKNHSNLHLYSSFPFYPHFNLYFSNTTNLFSSIIVSSQKSGSSGFISEEKKALYERYGLNPKDYLPESSSSKSRKKKEVRRTGKGKQIVEEEEKVAEKPPRTTHKLLQVLGGKAKRKKLLSPAGMNVRPMMEVVKGSAFDILQAAGGCPVSLRPGRWLDLYSGTGSVGIEAISRGCSEVHFVEMDPWVISNVLQPNLESTGFLDISVIHPVRVEDFLERAEQFVGRGRTFDFISVTPPYMEVNYGTLMGQISNSPLVGEDTFIVVEYPLRTDMLDTCGCLMKIADRRFGRTHLAIYGPEWAQKKRSRKVTSSVNGSLIKDIQSESE